MAEELKKIHCQCVHKENLETIPEVKREVIWQDVKRRQVTENQMRQNRFCSHSRWTPFIEVAGMVDVVKPIGKVFTSVVDADPFFGCLGSGSGSGSVSYSNGTTKLTKKENLTKNTFCVGPVGSNDKENQVKIYKKYCETVRIRICIKQSDSE
jgi:hypothetical protein